MSAARAPTPLSRSHGEGATLSFLLNLPHASAAAGASGFRVGGGAGAGLVWLCECQKGFQKYPATMGDLDAAASVFVDVHVDETTARRRDYTPKKGTCVGLLQPSPDLTVLVYTHVGVGGSRAFEACAGCGPVLQDGAPATSGHARTVRGAKGRGQEHQRRLPPILVTPSLQIHRHRFHT